MPAVARTSGNPAFMSATDLREAFLARRLSPVEALESALDQIARLNPTVNAFVTMTTELAYRQARAAEANYARGETTLPLLGIPITIKDIIPTQGIRTTYGSRVFENHVPEQSGPVAERLLGAGSVLLGKTAASEFAWKSPTSSPLLGHTRNPWNTDLTPGGSSGGSAVAVATGMGAASVGTDTGGSIRQPASFCGVTALKPSSGRVASSALSTIASIDVTGPIARTVRDLALIMDVIAAEDDRDWYSIPGCDIHYREAVEGGVRGLRVAWSSTLTHGTCDPEVRSIAKAAAMRFQELGCTIEEAQPTWPDPGRLFWIFGYHMFAASVASYLDQWEDQMDPGLVQIIKDPQQVTLADVAKATIERAALQEVSRRFFDRFDILLTPTMALEPFPLGIDFPSEIAGEPVQGMGWTPFTYPFNLTGQPAVSVPAGWTSNGLPVGLQIVGPWRKDARVLRAAAAFEAIAPWAHRWPPIVAREVDALSPNWGPTAHPQPTRLSGD